MAVALKSHKVLLIALDDEGDFAAVVLPGFANGKTAVKTFKSSQDAILWLKQAGVPDQNLPKAGVRNAEFEVDEHSFVALSNKAVTEI